MALGVAETDAVFQDVGRGAGDGGEPAVRAVADLVADPEEAAPGDFLVVGGIARDLGGHRDDRRVVAIYGGGWGEEFVHGYLRVLNLSPVCLSAFSPRKVADRNSEKSLT